jgi:hypothetical protein
MEEWFEDSPSATLHGGIRKVAKRLKDGDSVVLDDCNPSEKARESLITALRKQVPDFILEGVEFRPKGGLAQSQVGSEFVSASESEKLELERLHMSIDVDSSDSSSNEESDESDEDVSDKPKQPTRRGLEQILDSGGHGRTERRRQEILKVCSF